MKYFKIIYNSFLWSTIIAITCFKSEWLEMRVNMGYILFGALIFLTAIFSIYSRKKELKLNGIFTILNLIICTAYGMITYGFDRLKVVPASIIREGINITRVPFFTINLILVIILFVGLVIIIFDDYKEKNKRKYIFVK